MAMAIKSVDCVETTVYGPMERAFDALETDNPIGRLTRRIVTLDILGGVVGGLWFLNCWL